LFIANLFRASQSNSRSRAGARISDESGCSMSS
jgi:hypothetical protein